MPDIDIDGVRIHYDRSGAGPAVLMLQGAGLTGAAWKPQVDDLSADYTVLTVDNRGVGGSAMGNPAALTVERMAADALAVLDAERLGDAHVVGHSMGGSIATALAIAAPSRVRSLALLCTFRRGRDATALTPAVLWFGMRTRVGTRAMRRNAFLALVMPRDALRTADRAALAREVADVFGRDLADPPGMTMAQLRALTRYDAGAQLAGLATVATLVASGAEDRIARPASGRALAGAIPGARFVEMPRAGHALTISHADEVNALLREHFERVETVIHTSPEVHHATQDGR